MKIQNIYYKYDSKKIKDNNYYIQLNVILCLFIRAIKRETIKQIFNNYLEVFNFYQKRIIDMQKKRTTIFLARYLKRIIGMIAVFAVFMAITHKLGYLYTWEDQWYRILWHNFYEDEGKIDNLYLGSSHVYCDIDPRILDELNGMYNFNLASPRQKPNGSYYLLREAGQRNELSHVYLELYYMCSVENNFCPGELVPEEYGWNWWNTDYMKASGNKLFYMLSIGGAEKYVDIFLPFSRHRAQLGNWDYVKQNMARKKEEKYRCYQYYVEHSDGNGYDAYLKQGFFDSGREFKEQSRYYLQERILGENPMLKESKEYYRRIIRYCQKREIPITLFISPIHNLQLVSTVSYDNYVKEARAFAEECGVPFYDFNLTKEEYLPIQRGECFRDIGHLNSVGAGIYTPFFYQVVSGKEVENAQYFHDSYAEKLQEAEPEVYGLYYRDSEDNEEASEKTRNVWVASNREVGMEYRIILTPTEGEQYMVQDFDANKMFTVPLAEHGICTIVARTEGKPDEVQTMEINY